MRAALVTLSAYADQAEPTATAALVAWITDHLGAARFHDPDAPHAPAATAS